MFATLQFDGACRGNPGLVRAVQCGVGSILQGGAGAVLLGEDGQPLAQLSRFVGTDATNNTAEYAALELGLEAAVQRQARAASCHVV